MRYLKYAALLAVLFLAAVRANAQVRVGVAIGAGPVAVAVGPAPVCAFGYYGYYPYACAPRGFYGPQYFVNGVFIGAGPWHRGPRFYAPHYGPGYYDRPVYAPRTVYRGPATRARTVHGYVRNDFHGHR
jgi:hypothetical protein